MMDKSKERQNRKEENTVDLGFARLDGDRAARTGEPETIFCQGKTPAQVAEILQQLLQMHPEENILGTRADEAAYLAARELVPDVCYDEMARVLYVRRTDETDGRSVAVVSAGTADMPVAEEVALCASLLGHDVVRIYDVGVAGVHRLLAHEETIRACDVVIVVAGMEGALASVVGGLVSNPVIAVPTSVGYGANFGGLSAMLTMINSCANGIAVVNIDNGYGAGYMATQINRLACGGVSKNE
jgi:NCAIR mutase (PurE)-related protein